MRILIIYSGNSETIAPFVADQIEWLTKTNISYEMFPISGKGIYGYLKNIRHLRRYLNNNFKRFDLIHAHYGLSGLVATFQSKLPVVITYHGSDIHQKKVFRFSKIAIKRANHNIFVSEKLKNLANQHKNCSVIPCGVDLTVFKKMDRMAMREKLGLSLDKNYVLFSSNFNRAIKNPEIAIKAIEQTQNTELIELKGFSREKVAQMMNAVDACLLTSQAEGSPQFIKEAAACNRFIITTDVGDIQEILKNYRKVKFVKPEINEIKKTVEEILKNNDETLSGNFNLSKYNNEVIVEQLIKVYKRVLSK